MNSIVRPELSADNIVRWNFEQCVDLMYEEAPPKPCLIECFQSFVGHVRPSQGLIEEER